MQDQQPSSSGILPPLCLFCNKSRKRLKNGAVEFLRSCETLEASANIQEAASKLNDQEMLSTVTGADLVAKEAKYHHSCKSAYLMIANRSSAKKVTVGNETVSASVKKGIAIENIYANIEKSIIVDNRPELMTSIYD